ncbi:hypothetical protein [Sphaerisporangium fuscum]|nr:hypothetical protein [Sphaerisporangium fuscum]
MPFEFLSGEQVARYGRLPEEPSPAAPEQFWQELSEIRWASVGLFAIIRT